MTPRPFNEEGGFWLLFILASVAIVQLQLIWVETHRARREADAIRVMLTRARTKE